MRLSDEVIRFLTVKQESDEPLPAAIDEPEVTVAAVSEEE